MKRYIFVFLLIASVIPVFAQNATVEKVSGKVEYLVAGSSWTPVAVGDVIPIGATISTGFRSSAILMVGSSEISVMALTRMSIEELAETSDTVSTSLNLRTGKVRASVRSTAGKSTNFTLRSPVSTAAVRGTEFVFEDYRLLVIEGLMEYANSLNEAILISGGNVSEIPGFYLPTDAEEGQKKNSKVEANTSGESLGTGYTGSGDTGNLTIIVGS